MPGNCAEVRNHHLWSSPTVRDSNTLAKCKRGAGSLAKGNQIIEPLVVQAGGSLNPAYCELIKQRCDVTPGFAF